MIQWYIQNKKRCWNNLASIYFQILSIHTYYICFSLVFEIFLIYDRSLPSKFDYFKCFIFDHILRLFQCILFESLQFWLTFLNHFYWSSLLVPLKINFEFRKFHWQWACLTLKPITSYQLGALLNYPVPSRLYKASTRKRRL